MDEKIRSVIYDALIEHTKNMRKYMPAPQMEKKTDLLIRNSVNSIMKVFDEHIKQVIGD